MRTQCALNNFLRTSVCFHQNKFARKENSSFSVRWAHRQPKNRVRRSPFASRTRILPIQTTLRLPKVSYQRFSFFQRKSKMKLHVAFSWHHCLYAKGHFDTHFDTDLQIPSFSWNQEQYEFKIAQNASRNEALKSLLTKDELYDQGNNSKWLMAADNAWPHFALILSKFFKTFSAMDMIFCRFNLNFFFFFLICAGKSNDPIKGKWMFLHSYYFPNKILISFSKKRVCLQIGAGIVNGLQTLFTTLFDVYRHGRLSRTFLLGPSKRWLAELQRLIGWRFHLPSVRKDFPRSRSWRQHSPSEGSHWAVPLDNALHVPAANLVPRSAHCLAQFGSHAGTPSIGSSHVGDGRITGAAQRWFEPTPVQFGTFGLRLRDAGCSIHSAGSLQRLRFAEPTRAWVTVSLAGSRILQ